jgi:23S rRNA (guanosine2251-2'-O)-methyltransferase
MPPRQLAVNKALVKTREKFTVHLFLRMHLTIPLDRHHCMRHPIGMTKPPENSKPRDKPGQGTGETTGPAAPGRTMSEAHNSHHAEKRRARRELAQKKQGNKPEFPPRPTVGVEDPSRLYVYGLHTVRHAMENPERRKLGLYVTPNALTRLDLPPHLLGGIEVHDTYPRDLDRMVGSDAVHQGCVLEVAPLQPKSLSEISGAPLILVLDQVTDPHNVGAIMRSAVAMGAGALITTSRHSPVETGVLAKSASGALDMIDQIEVRNLADALVELSDLGYQTIGLDSEGPDILENSISGTKVALVLGSEGKGLRQKTRETCATLARVDMPGAIKSLNVSNAAALALYIVRQKLPNGN